MSCSLHSHFRDEETEGRVLKGTEQVTEPEFEQLDGEGQVLPAPRESFFPGGAFPQRELHIHLKVVVL